MYIYNKTFTKQRNIKSKIQNNCYPWGKAMGSERNMQVAAMELIPSSDC